MAKRKKPETYPESLFRYPVKSTDVPVTQTMLYNVRDELKADIGVVRSDVTVLKSDVATLKSEMGALETRLTDTMGALETRLSGRMSALEERLSLEMQSQFHKLSLLFEEQNARNIFVLDGLTALFNRQDRLEKDQVALRQEWANYSK